MPASRTCSSAPGPRQTCAGLLPAALLLSTVLTLGSCAPLTQSDNSMTPTPGQIQAAVTICDSSAAHCTAGSSIQLQFARDLEVVVNWQNVPAGTHTQKVSFLLPGGDLYQAVEKSFAVAEGSGGPVSTMQVLPLAGTWITQRRLTGVWSVALELDGQPMGTQTVQFTP